MADLALYRKFRPSTFAEVKGQDAIVRTLSNQVASDKLSHAYLFCGTRGTGKTTVAKILAKAVNCQDQQNGNPCDKCEMCESINQNASTNVVEIDAASNNGVDDIRNLKEEVMYSPTAGKYKVYIIDEVHMLSTSAFNALLKTLEEPPKHAIFILATTESHKVPATISSRCQKYNFKRINHEVIVKRINEVLQIENRKVDDKAINYIAKLADGSMRDALSLLDRCLAFYLDRDLTFDDVLEALGGVDITDYAQLISAINDSDDITALKILGDMVQSGKEIDTILSDFIWYLRNLLMISNGIDSEESIDVSSENLETMKEIASKTNSKQLMTYINKLCETSDRLKFSNQKRVMLEVDIIRLMKPEMDTSSEGLESRVRALENRGNGTASIDETQLKNMVESLVAAKTAGLGVDTLSSESQISKPKLPKAMSEDLKEIVSNYRKLVGELGNPLKTYLTDTKISMSTSGNLLIVVLNDQLFELIDSRKNEIMNFFSTKLQKDVVVEVSKVSKGRTFEQEFVNIEDLIKAEIEVEDI